MTDTVKLMWEQVEKARAVGTFSTAREDSMMTNKSEIDLALIAFGVATTQTEIDPDRRWEAIKHVSEFLGKLRLAASRPAQEPSPHYRHKKRGSIVREIARGFAQVAVHPIEEMTAVVIYQHISNGVWWVRNAVEFDDGRFEPLPLTGENEK